MKQKAPLPTQKACAADLPKPQSPPAHYQVCRSMLRRPKVKERTGYGNTTLYDLIQKGLFVPGVNIGGRCVAWPDDEVEAIMAARIAGKSDAEIKTLVSELLNRRKGESQNEVMGEAA